MPTTCRAVSFGPLLCQPGSLCHYIQPNERKKERMKERKKEKNRLDSAGRDGLVCIPPLYPALIQGWRGSCCTAEQTPGANRQEQTLKAMLFTKRSNKYHLTEKCSTSRSSSHIQIINTKREQTLNAMLFTKRSNKYHLKKNKYSMWRSSSNVQINNTNQEQTFNAFHQILK